MTIPETEEFEVSLRILDKQVPYRISYPYSYGDELTPEMAR